jgi:hypothetical protein
MCANKLAAIECVSQQLTENALLNRCFQLALRESAAYVLFVNCTCVATIKDVLLQWKQQQPFAKSPRICVALKKNLNHNYEMSCVNHNAALRETSSVVTDNPK